MAGDVRLSLPAAAGDFPDPFVLFTGQRYVAYATASGRRHIQVRESADLHTWTDLPDGLPQVATWSKPGRTWSPAVFEAGGRWVLWYATIEPVSGRQALSVAMGDAPTGPFVDLSSGPAVLQADLGGSIDPSPFRDLDGTSYMVWKADSNAIGRPSTLWAQPMSKDGTSVVGEPTMLLTHDRVWERPLIEAPCIMKADDGYLLLYSAGTWNSRDYAIGVARATHPLGPWAKLSTDSAWASSDPVAEGPGGQEIFTAADGSLMLAYHAWEPGRVRYRDGGVRALRVGHLGIGGGQLSLVPLDEPN